MKSLFVICLVLFCSACIQLGTDTPPLHYYLMQPNAEAQRIPVKAVAGVTLAPFQLPAYLDRLQLTTHNDQNQVLIGNLDRWSEPLNESFTRILTENLVRHLQDDKGDLPGQKSANKKKYQVKLVVNSFDGILGQQTTVDIRWSIIEEGSTEPPLKGHFVDNKPIGNSYAELVQGLNNALNSLSYTLALKLAENN